MIRATGAPSTTPTPHARRVKLQVDAASKRFGPTQAVDDVSLAVEDGEFLTLLGGSGSGKSTLLRLIAGLNTLDSGSISIDGIDVTAAPARRRKLGMVFQNYSLFPHLSVEDNVGYGLQLRGWPRARRRARVADMLGMIDLADLGRRRPSELSGGQQQRVALARALATEPSLLMLDEPLAALDVTLRRQMQMELRRLHRESGTTFLLVTHDQDEALFLSDRIAVMRAGRIEQIDTPRTLYETPANSFVGGFVGQASLLAATAVADARDAADVESFGRVRLATPAPGAVFKVLIRPEQLVFGHAAAGTPIRIVDIAFGAGTTLYSATLANGALLQARALGPPSEALAIGTAARATLTGPIAWV